MWSDAAKDKMRQAAHRAGIVDSPASQALVIALEPEAAALYARHEEGGPLAMSAGHTFMVVDAGGGTVDITVHQVVRRGGELALAEMTAGVGALFGATYVDEAFVQHFRSMVGGGDSPVTGSQ
jgi:molecular chaperone DnaK (HSP70)